MNDERAEEGNAEHVGDDVTVGSDRGRRDEHRLAELRSLALHGRIAARVALDPTLVDRARAVLERQAASGP